MQGSASIAELSAAALRSHRGGQLAEAERLYRQALAVEPDHVESLHNLGVLARQVGRHAAAADLFARAIFLNDQISTLHSNLGAALKALGKPAEAAAAYGRAIALKSDNPVDHYNLANSLGACGRAEEAVAAYGRAIALKPDLVEAHYNLASALASLERPGEAEAAYGRAIALQPDHAEAHNNLGALLKARGALDEAAQAYRRVIALKPDLAEAHYNLGAVLRDKGQLDEAAAAYRRAIALKPDYAEAHNNLGVILGQTGGLEEAATAYRRAIALKPDYAEAHYNLGGAQKDQGELAAATASYRRALELKPDHAGAYYHLAGLASMNDGSPAAETLFTLLSRHVGELERFEPSRRAQLLFAMGKALEDRGEFDRAFARMAEANTICRARFDFEVEEAERSMASIAEVFDARLLERLRGGGLASDRPIFIVGMPRSGTTLVEQIISTHPDVRGAGEILNLPRVLAAHGVHDDVPDSQWATALTAADCRSIGLAYVDSLPAGETGHRRVTDKLLSNFQRLGLIHLCLPQARIIHCRRDPRDVALSCYGIHFRNGLEYAYDLVEFARYWRAYDRLMTHWREVLPPGRILEIPYEAVTADVEGWTRRLIAHCGLEWNDACLRFFESKREVRTASSVQVRRPVYTGSVGRWRPFARHLGPLLEALGEPWASG